MFGCLSDAQAGPLTLKAAVQIRSDKTQQLISETLTCTLATFEK